MDISRPGWTTLRWLVCIPFGLILGSFVSGCCLLLGDFLLGGWRLTSGVVIFLSAAWFPAIAFGCSMGIAPRQDRLTKWLVLTPHLILAAFFSLPALANAIFAPDVFLEIASEHEGPSRSLPIFWQQVIGHAGYLITVLVFASQSTEDLLSNDPGEAANAKQFRLLFRQAVSPQNPGDRIVAAQEALALLESAPFQTWPFRVPSSPRVARGSLLAGLARAYHALAERDPQHYSALAIAALEQAGDWLEPADGEAWAEWMSNSSIIYANDPAGDPGLNLERAIECAEAALTRLDAQAHRAIWLQTMSNLSGFLMERTLGDSEDNVEKALAVQTEVLSALSRESQPLDWAVARAGLGLMYLKRAGNRVQNVEQARGLLAEALRLIPKAKWRFDWAMTAVSLASVYSDSVMAQDPRNEEQAALLLTEAIEVFRDLGKRGPWAEAQANLGALKANSRAGNRAEAVGGAIECFEQALTYFTAEAFPHDHARISRNLASIYLERRNSSRPETVAAALGLARQISQHFNRATTPFEWANAQASLGLALLESRGGDRAVSIEEAITCFREAIELLKPGSEIWALRLGHLANAYAARIAGDPGENLEEAIRLQEEAIAGLDPSQHPDTWVSAMQNLAVSYVERLTGSEADNVEKSIALIERALVLRSSFFQPEHRSELLEQLGTGFAQRRRGELQDNLERAVHSFQAAAEFRRPEAGMAAWLRLDQKLLRARIRHQQLDSSEAEHEKEKEDRPSLTEILARQNEKAAAISPDDDLRTWVTGQMELGDFYRQLVPNPEVGSRVWIEAFRTNLNRALECYGRGVAQITRLTEPQLWIVIHERMATAYQLLNVLLDEPPQSFFADDDPGVYGTCEPGLAHEALQNAVAALTEALSTERREARQLLRNQLRLGELQVQCEDWTSASRAFSRAAQAADSLLADIEVNEQELAAVLQDMGMLASLAPHVFVATGLVKQALEAAEMAKARFIAKSLTLEALEISSEERSRLESLQAEIRHHEARLLSPLLVDRMPPLDAVMRARRALNGIELGDKVRKASDWIEEIVADGSTLVFPFLAGAGCSIVVCFRQGKESRIESILGSRPSGALRYLRRGLGPAQADWRDLYSRYKERRLEGTWQEALESVARTLGSAFLEPLQTLLNRCAIGPGARLHLLPDGLLGVLPLAIAQDPATGESLIQRFELSLAPSLRVLRAAQAGSATNGGEPSLALCTYATDLQFLDFEAEMVASRFIASAVTRLNGGELSELEPPADKEKILQALAGRNIWHFAAHGIFRPTQLDQSGIQLAPGRLFSVAELLRTKFATKPALVVLSACETGLFDQEELPNEFIGLPVVFLQAGAAGVIATLWRVNDAAAALLFARFYEYYLDDRVAPATALRQAQLWLRDSNAKDLEQVVRRWASDGRISARNAQSMVCEILSRDQPGQTPFGAVNLWGGFVYYGA